MSLTPAAIQARIDRAQALYGSADGEAVIGRALGLFRLDPAGEPDEFTYPASKAASRDRLFGGQVIAQASVAAAQTVEAGKTLHSLHAYFLRGGDETKPLHFRVHRDFDGRSFANRRVVVRQDGKVIFNLTASFHTPETGLSHQTVMPDLLPPEQCSDFVEIFASNPRVDDAQFDAIMATRPFEVRRFQPQPGAASTQQYQWIRSVAPVGDDPQAHLALLAYASDMGLLSAALLPHNLRFRSPGLVSASLDHAMWFHDDVCVDDWLVFVMDSDWSGGARGINRGLIYRQDGTLIATAMQEGLMRYNPPA